ncbi:MAG: putative bifunctional diguanylate cyclase/phosphodiesterase [Bacillota bacterium]
MAEENYLEQLKIELDDLRRQVADLVKEKQDTSIYQSINDPLTGLPNRILFKDRLNLAMAQARRNRQVLAVLLLGLDRFKVINDSLGHNVGDRLLQQVAVRLSHLMRKSDTVARLGGDEFAVLAMDISKDENAARVSQKILEIFTEPFIIGGHELYATASIGIATFPNDGEDAEALIINADTAMYRAKEHGKNTYRLYTPEMNAKALQRLELENSMRRATERGEFEVFYQPKVNIKTGIIGGFEALVRWRHRERGLVSPAEFIPLAEETGLIIPIGEWVLRTACEQNRKWMDAGYPPLRVAVNISARQFQQKNLVERVDQALQETGLHPSWLELEITESVAMQDAEFTIKMLRDFKERGITISLDDFGTGYSSLNYLKRFPLNNLKIDQSFIRNITTDSDDEAIASAVIVLAQNLKLQVIAEGVETKEQLAILRERQCNEMQGYLVGKPVPADEFEKLLKIHFTGS